MRDPQIMQNKAFSVHHFKNTPNIELPPQLQQIKCKCTSYHQLQLQQMSLPLLGWAM